MRLRFGFDNNLISFCFSNNEINQIDTKILNNIEFYVYILQFWMPFGVVLTTYMP